MIEIRPVTLAEANAFVEKLHRHHKKTQGHRFSLAAHVDGKRVGVAILGRPVARMTDFSKVLEVTRLCTDGTPNIPSALYGASARVAKAMGFEKIQTFILASEPGISLRDSGWVCEGGVWSRPSRSRTGASDGSRPLGVKMRWSKQFRGDSLGRTAAQGQA